MGKKESTETIETCKRHAGVQPTPYPKQTVARTSRRERALRPSAVYLLIAGVSLLLCLCGLGSSPFIDPSEGLHAAIAYGILQSGDWLMLHFNGVPYFDKPPLPYWLMAVGFSFFSPTEWAARIWPALFCVATAILTGWLGIRLGSPRTGLIAGLIVVTNPGFFIFGLLVRADMLIIFLITAAFCCFVIAYQQQSQAALLGCYATLGLAVIAKDFLGALGPLATFALFSFATRRHAECPWSRWISWKGLALFGLLAVPWYLLVEWEKPGFLWYTIMDKHVLNFTRERVFPDEDIPLTALEFLMVTAIAFFPWILTYPLGVISAFRQAWKTSEGRLWFLMGVWTLVVIGFFTVSPFKLPHYGLPAFPQMALLVAKVWNDRIEDNRGGRSSWALLIPAGVTFGMLALLAFAISAKVISSPSDWLMTADLSTRNRVLRDQNIPFLDPGHALPLIWMMGAVCAGGCVGLCLAAWKKSLQAAVAILTIAMFVNLIVVGHGMSLFAQARSVTPIKEFLQNVADPEDVLVYEGALENAGSIVVGLKCPLRILKGNRSNLSFGSTFPEGKKRFWTGEQLRRAWTSHSRVFLISGRSPDRSLVRHLPHNEVHVILKTGGRRLYSNVPLPSARAITAHATCWE